jgi:WD40 repeat protein
LRNADAPIKCWDFKRAEVIAENCPQLSTMAAAADHSCFLSGHSDGRCELWARTGEHMASFRPATGSVHAVAIHPSGTAFAAAGADGSAWIWPGSGAARAIRAHTGVADAVGFAPDGRLLFTAGGDKAIRLWDATTGALLAALTGHEGAVKAVAMSSDGLLLLSGSRDRTCRVWIIDREVGGA